MVNLIERRNRRSPYFGMDIGRNTWDRNPDPITQNIGQLQFDEIGYLNALPRPRPNPFIGDIGGMRSGGFRGSVRPYPGKTHDQLHNEAMAGRIPEPTGGMGFRGSVKPQTSKIASGRTDYPIGNIGQMPRTDFPMGIGDEVNTNPRGMGNNAQSEARMSDEGQSVRNNIGQLQGPANDNVGIGGSHIGKLSELFGSDEDSINRALALAGHLYPNQKPSVMENLINWGRNIGAMSSPGRSSGFLDAANQAGAITDFTGGGNPQDRVNAFISLLSQFENKRIKEAQIAADLAKDRAKGDGTDPNATEAEAERAFIKNIAERQNNIVNAGRDLNAGNINQERYDQILQENYISPEEKYEARAIDAKSRSFLKDKNQGILQETGHGKSVQTTYGNEVYNPIFSDPISGRSVIGNTPGVPSEVGQGTTPEPTGTTAPSAPAVDLGQGIPVSSLTAPAGKVRLGGLWYDARTVQEAAKNRNNLPVTLAEDLGKAQNAIDGIADASAGIFDNDGNFKINPGFLSAKDWLGEAIGSGFRTAEEQLVHRGMKLATEYFGRDLSGGQIPPSEEKGFAEKTQPSLFEDPSGASTALRNAVGPILVKYAALGMLDMFDQESLKALYKGNVLTDNILNWPNTGLTPEQMAAIKDPAYEYYDSVAKRSPRGTTKTPEPGSLQSEWEDF